jgi:hypothetical protein
MAETPQTANYREERDVLAEAGAILRGETRKIAAIEHLKAMQQLVRVATHFLATGTSGPGEISDWLREAGKVIG